MERVKPLMLGYELIALVGILLVGLFVSELLEDDGGKMGARQIIRLVLALSLYVYVLLSLVPLWVLSSEWRSGGCKALMGRLASVPGVLLMVSLVALIAVDSVSFLVKQEDKALFGAFHVLSMLCAFSQFIFLLLRRRRANQDMRLNSKFCDLLVVSIVCIYSALAVVDVVGSAYGYAHRIEKKLPQRVIGSNSALNHVPISAENDYVSLERDFSSHLFGLFSILIAAVFFYTLFILWHWTPAHEGVHHNVVAHWVVVTFDRVLLSITSSVTAIIFIVFICTQAASVTVIISLVVLLLTHILQTFLLVWLMDVKKIATNVARLGRLCQMAMVIYNVYAFLLYAFYANNAYESSTAGGKMVIVVSFFVATSFWDMAIHWSEFKILRPEDMAEEAVEDDGIVYGPVDSLAGLEGTHFVDDQGETEALSTRMSSTPGEAEAH